MTQSRIFVFLAVALSLVTCFSAVGEDANIHKAKRDVSELQELTTRVSKNAQAKLREAESVKRTGEDQKNKALRAESDAKKAAKEITETERKEEAEAVAKKAKEELTNCHTFHQEATNKADQASNALKEFLSRANELVQNATIEIPSASDQQIDYTNVIASAAAVKTQTEELSGEINASTLLSAAESALWTLKDGAKKVQVLKYQAESIAIVSQIEAMLNTAETHIQSIEKKRDKINTTVQKMDQTFKTAPEASKGFLSSLCSNAEGQLRTASKKVKDANKCEKDMQGRKTQVDADFEAVKATDEEDKANKEAGNLVLHKTFFAAEIEKITQALQEAENAVLTAESVHQQMKNTMSQNNSPSGSGVNNEKPKGNVPTEELTKPIQSGKAKTQVIPNTDKPGVIQTDKPAIIETEKTVLGKSEDSMDKKSNQPVDANLDSTGKQNKATQLAHKEKQNPKDDNAELLNKEKLRKITKNMTKDSLIGGEVPTRSAESDSAVTVFIPLMVVLVMSAVLH